MDKQIKIAVMMGGGSPEREVSLNSGKLVAEALKKQGYQVLTFDPLTDLEKLIQSKGDIDVVFPVFHGKGGEDGTVQGFLELLELPYVGPGIFASALTIDKLKTKKWLEEDKILMPKDMIIDKNMRFEEIEKKLGVPFIVKPIANGSSIGVEIVKSEDEYMEALERANKDDILMAEEYIVGDEITVGVLGNGVNITALPVILIKPKTTFFDYKAKYSGETDEIVPAPIDEKVAKLAQEVAVLVHKKTECRDFSRSDFIVKDSKVYFLEVNPIPGMTSESLVPKAAKALGISFEELVEKIVVFAMEGRDEVCQKANS